MLALICGSGDLPAAVASCCDRPPLVCALQGFAPSGLEPEITFRIETLGRLFAMLTARGVTDVCLCGHIRRPKVDLAALDEATLPLVPRLREALQHGDDGALRVVLALFEEAGFAVRAAHQAAPALLPPAGVPTEARPDPEIAHEARLGDAALVHMGAADLGQACVIRAGAVIAREEAAGTDAMLGRAVDWLPNVDGPRAGFLFKAPKPGQDRRADLPVIGPATARAVADAGLAGIVVEAGGVMVLHRTRTVAALDAAGLFLWVRERG